MSMVLLQTKLHIPRLRTGILPRPDLMAMLDAGLTRKLTLVSATAGFGKTTLITSWLDHAQRPAAWLSLDDGDNDPVRFWSYLIAAIQVIDPAFASALQVTLRSPQPPAQDVMLVELLNYLSDMSGPIVLVLDDYHLITNTDVDQGMLYLVENLPPHVHLVLCTRSDPPWPLARLRVRSEMQEVRSAQLRFSPGETQQFFGSIMGLTIHEHDIALLDRRTEGWIAGLQMVALSLKGHRDPSSFIIAFSSSHRYILDYLVEEVLDRQPADVNTFLMTTSILERLCAPVCDALMGWNQSESMLRFLEAANLFLIPLDDERRWYRYHHLFADLLRQRLQQNPIADVKQLHLVASAWFEDWGDIGEALRHAGLAGDTGRVLRLLESHALILALQGEHNTLREWIEDLPPAMVADRPWLHVVRAWILLPSGQHQASQQALDQAVQALATDTDLPESERIRIQGYIDLLSAYSAYFIEDIERTMHLAQAAVRELPEEDWQARVYAFTLKGAVARELGLLGQAEETLSQAIDLCEIHQELHLYVDALWESSVLKLTQGQLHEVMTLSQRALDLCQRYGRRQGQDLPYAGYAHTSRSIVLRLWHRLWEAKQHAEQAVSICQRWRLADAHVQSLTALSRVQTDLGDYVNALETIQKAQTASHHFSPWYGELLAAREAAIYLRAGNLDLASRWAERSPIATQSISYHRQGEFQALVEVYLAQHQLTGGRSTTKALAVLEKLIHFAQGIDAYGVLLPCLLHQTHAYYLLGQEEAAVTALRSALPIAAAGNFIQPFLDAPGIMLALLNQLSPTPEYMPYLAELRQILAGTAGVSEGSANGEESQIWGESLSDREMEVLHWLPSSLSSNEIAEQLFIAPSTVRSHLKSIYGKLNVHSRIQAVEEGRRRGLI